MNLKTVCSKNVGLHIPFHTFCSMFIGFYFLKINWDETKPYL